MRSVHNDLHSWAAKARSQGRDTIEIDIDTADRAAEQIVDLSNRIMDLEHQIRTTTAPALEEDGWQDISTAPKNGTEVLVMLKPKVIRLGWYFKPSSRSEGWCDENGKRIIPTHWMPLPAPPAPKEEG